MFTNLIESDSHRKEFKRRSSFFLVTIAAYTLLLFVAGIASIYAYDARLEAQNTELFVDFWLPPVKPIAADPPQPVRRASASTNTGRTTSQPIRPVLYESASNPIKTPDQISTAPNPIPPAPRNAVIGKYVADPVLPPSVSPCVSCAANGTGPAVPVDVTAPQPIPKPTKPPTQKVSMGVLVAHAISLPQPLYPIIAKQIRAQGPVNVQILVDEQGKVISAQPISGHPTLLGAAKEAALRARFTPTLLSGQPVKVQGVITYNFLLQ